MKLINNKITYEVDDWVVLLKSDYGTDNKVGDIGKITEVGGESCRVNVAGRDQISNWSHISEIRLATQEEIDRGVKEEQIYINDKPVIFSGDKLKIGCTTITKDLFLKIGKRADWI